MSGITPTGASLIAYNVGFGDCILLRVTYDDDSRRHVLFDFGSTSLPEKLEGMVRRAPGSAPTREASRRSRRRSRRTAGRAASTSSSSPTGTATTSPGSPEAPAR